MSALFMTVGFINRLLLPRTSIPSVMYFGNSDVRMLLAPMSCQLAACFRLDEFAE